MLSFYHAIFFFFRHELLFAYLVDQIEVYFIGERRFIMSELIVRHLQRGRLRPYFLLIWLIFLSIAYISASLTVSLFSLRSPFSTIFPPLLAPLVLQSLPHSSALFHHTLSYPLFIFHPSILFQKNSVLYF